MTASTGGYEIASAYVSVGIDLSTAQSGIAQLKSELASLTGSNYTVGGGGMVPASGTVTPMSLPSTSMSFSMQPTSVGNVGLVPAGGSFSVAGGGAAAAVQEAVAAISQQTHAAMTQVVQSIAQQFTSALGGSAGGSGAMPGLTSPLSFYGGGGIPLSLGAAPMPESYADKVLRMWQQPAASAGGGGSGMGMGYVNPFSIRGAARFAGTATVAYGAMLLAHEISGTVSGLDAASTAYDIDSEHAELYHPGSAVHLESDPVAQGQAQRIRDLRYRIGLSKSMPFRGIANVFGAVDSDDARTEADIANSRRLIGDRQAGLSRAQSQRGQLARLRGDAVGATIAEQEEILSATPGGQSLSSPGLTYRDGYGNQVQASTVYENQVALGQMEIERSRHTVVGESQSIAGSIFGYQYSTLAAGLRGRAAGMSANGEELESMQVARHATELENRAAIENYNGETEKILGATPEARRGAVRAERDAGRDNLTAKLKEALDVIDASIDKMKRKYESSGQAVRNDIAREAQESDLTSQQARHRFYSELVSGQASVASSAFRLANDPYRAAMTELESRRRVIENAPAVGAIQRGMALGEVSGQEENLTRRHQFDIQVANEGYDARIAAAGLEAGYRPLAASATMEVDRARHEIAMASPEERAKVIAANRAELESRRKLLTQQRGGDVGIDMSMHEAMGLLSTRGVDLSGRQLDIAKTRQIYESGAKGLDKSPDASAAGAGNEAFVKACNQFAAWVQKMLQSNGKKVAWPF